MYLNRNDENIALQLQYSNILLTKSLVQSIRETVDLSEFSIFADTEGEFLIFPDSEKVEYLNESHHQLAHLVGEVLFQEHPIDLDTEVYLFRIEYRNQGDEDYESVLSVTVKDMPEVDLEEDPELEDLEEEEELELEESDYE